MTMVPRCPGTTRWGRWPSPLGLAAGVAAAFAAQLLVIAYHCARLRWTRTRRVQHPPRPYDVGEGIRSHLTTPGGLVTMLLYLCATWMFDALPCSYYRFDAIRWWMVAAQIACQDLLMFLVHVFEHRGPMGQRLYRASHQPHHRFPNPRLFDAFDGSVLDTCCMILLPLATTARVLHASTGEYILFGAGWSAWLCLIHSEVHHPWDGAFRRLGLGTAADHHVHHRTLIWNYGHTMTWWDRLAGTYRRPEAIFKKEGA